MSADGLRSNKISVLTLTCLAQFMVLLDNTIVTTALPTMQRYFHTSLTGLQWIVDSYVLSVAVLLLAGGATADRRGRKRVFLAGLVLFTLASGLCSVATTEAVLIAGRVLQGVGAAALSPAGLALIASTYTEPRERTKAIGLWAGISGIGLSVGPLAGGALVDAVGWQAIFLINIPIGIGATAVGAKLLAESRNPNRGAVDLVGLVLCTSGTAALTYGLIEAGSRGWTSGWVLACFASAAVLLTGFVVRQGRTTSPILPLGFFRQRLFTVANIGTVAVGFGLLGSSFFFAQFFQIVQGYSAFRAGLQALPNTAAIFICGPLAGRVAARYGYRLPVCAGLACAAVGLGALSLVQADTPYSNVWWRLALVGIGFGFALSPLTGAAVSSVRPQESGIASGVSNTSRQIGSVLGVAVLGTVVRLRESHGATFASGLNTAFLTSCLLIAVAAVVTGLWLTRSARPTPAPGPALVTAPPTALPVAEEARHEQPVDH